MVLMAFSPPLLSGLPENGLGLDFGALVPGREASVSPMPASTPLAASSVSASISYDITTTSDWTILDLDGPETLSGVSCSKIYDGGAGSVSITWTSKRITISKPGNTATVEYYCGSTLSGLDGGDSYVD